MNTCHECGLLDALDRHSAICQRARSLGLQRLAEGEARVEEPPPEAPEPPPQTRARRAPAEPRLFVVEGDDQRMLDGVVWTDGQVVVSWRETDTHSSSLAIYPSLRTFEEANELGAAIEWADERVAQALAALQAAVGGT